MERETVERALHLWPAWHQSIEQSRRELGYDPTWPVDQAIAWIKTHYGADIRPRAFAELRRLDLPSDPFFEYWEDCFYCDYRRADGSTDFNKIKRRIAVGARNADGYETAPWSPPARSLPPMPYHVSIVNYPGEDLGDPYVRMEFMVYAPLASKDLLDNAAKDAWMLLKHTALMPGAPIGRRAHPLSGLMRRAKANRSDKKRDALARYRRGEIDVDGLLMEEWQAPDIQEWRQHIAKGVFGRDQGTKQKKIRAVQKAIYDRVMRWFPNPKPKPSRDWRQRLQEPPKG